MSRAFVKEPDHIALDRPPDFDLGNAPNFVTKSGASHIAAKVATIEAGLASQPDEATRNSLERDLRYWQARKESMQIIVTKNLECVQFGTRVCINREGKTLTVEIVGQDEADPSGGRINWQSPLAKALIGARVGEVVYLEIRNTPMEIAILSIAQLC